MVKINLLIILSLFLNGNFYGQNNPGLIQKKFDKAVNMINKSEAKGLFELLEIANDDYKYGAEFSEDAVNEINYCLYKKPVFWIETFSKVNFEKIKRYIDSCGLLFESMPNKYIAYDSLSREMIKKLVAIKTSPTNKKLIDYIINYFKN